jgi:hypothetical protein
MIGTPSVLLILLTADLVARRFGRPLFPDSDLRLLLGGVSIASIALYPSALELFPFDIYRVGFHPVTPLVIAIAGAFIAARNPRVAAAIFLTLIAFDFHLLAATNLWDYFLDPLLALIAIAWALVRLFGLALKRTRDRKRPGRSLAERLTLESMRPELAVDSRRDDN